MELMSMDGFTFGSLASNWVSASAVFAIGALHIIFKKNRYYKIAVLNVRINYYYRVIGISFLAVALAWCISKIEIKIDGDSVGFWGAFLLTMLIFFALSSWRYASVGIQGAERSVEKGTGYQDSLDLCRNSLWFLGTGGAKLTSCPNFEEAIQRCSKNTGAVRFLLAAPDSNVFVKAAKNANEAPAAYSHNVNKSLAVLKKLKEERSFDFEVRFYMKEDSGDKQDFRIFIADQRIALVSYNVYGRSDAGKYQPQIVLSKEGLGISEDTFYFPFEQMFLRIWSSAEPWDFKKYVK